MANSCQLHADLLHFLYLFICLLGIIIFIVILLANQSCVFVINKVGLGLGLLGLTLLEENGNRFRCNKYCFYRFTYTGGQVSSTDT